MAQVARDLREKAVWLARLPLPLVEWVFPAVVAVAVP